MFSFIYFIIIIVFSYIWWCHHGVVALQQWGSSLVESLINKELMYVFYLSVFNIYTVCIYTKTK
jgi:hypothetical protein